MPCTGMISHKAKPFTSYLDALENKGNIIFGNNFQDGGRKKLDHSKSAIQVPKSIKHSCNANWSAGCL